MDIPADIAVNAAMTRQAFALQMVKKSAEMEKAVVNMLDEATQNLAASGRGSSLNITV